MDFHKSFTDVHCHILPGLDDGARSLEQAREMFDLRPGDEILVLGDKEKGIAILPKEKEKEFIKQIFCEIE